MSSRGYYAVKVLETGEKLSPDKQALAREGKFRMTVWFLTSFAIITLVMIYAFSPNWLSGFKISLAGWLRWLGVFLGVVCLILLAWVKHTLGKYWSYSLQLRQKHVLIEIGPYRFVRHPMYSAFMLFLFSLFLISSNWTFLILLIMVYRLFYLRISKEEAMLLEYFGNQYRSYMQKTGRFLPRFFI